MGGRTSEGRGAREGRGKWGGVRVYGKERGGEGGGGRRRQGVGEGGGGVWEARRCAEVMELGVGGGKEGE